MVPARDIMSQPEQEQRATRGLLLYTTALTQSCSAQTLISVCYLTLLLINLLLYEASRVRPCRQCKQNAIRQIPCISLTLVVGGQQQKTGQAILEPET